MQPLSVTRGKEDVTVAAKYSIIKEHPLYKDLRELYDEACSCASSLTEDNHRCEEELEYMSDFIRFMGLSEEYKYFREHAHRDEQDEMPFPYYIL